MFRKLSTTVLLLLLGTPLVALAQGTGTLAGRVTDADTGEGLPGANVIVEGTQLGAATDLDGNYRIIGIPVGEYDVTSRFVGFEEETVADVQISSGYTTQQDFDLSSGVVLDEIEIVYERPIIQRDAIGAPRVVTGEEIQNLPVRGVSNVAALQGGVVSAEGSEDLNIRGGREQEVQYYVDGVKVTNELLGVNQSAIQEQEMLLGTIPARYGDVQSGVISITTKSGSPEFFGSAEVVTSEVLDAYGYNLATLAVGGPLVPGSVSFFLSGEGLFQSDSSPFAIETFRLSDEAFANLQANPQLLQLTNADGDLAYIPFPYEAVQAGIDADGSFTENDLVALVADDIPEGFSLASASPIGAAETFTAEDFELDSAKDDPLSQLTFNGNLNFNFTSALSLRLGGGYTTRDTESWSFYNSLYNRDRFYNRERDSWRVYGTFRQRVSDNAFYQLQAEYQDDRFTLYPEGFSNNVEDALFYGDVNHPYNELASRYFTFTNGEFQRQFPNDGNALVGEQVANFTFFVPGNPSPSSGGGSGVFFQQSHDNTLRFSGSATTQLDVHQLEFGGEFQQDTRRFYSLSGLGLARYFDDREFDGDGNVIPGTGPELGREEGYSSYAELPFNAFDPRVTYYGYDFRGLNEVDDENIDAFLNIVDDATGARENSNIAPYEPIYYAGYIQDKIEFRDLVINLGLRVDVFDNNTLVLRDIFAAKPVLRAGDLDSAPSGIESDFAVYFNNEGDVVGYRDLDGNFFGPEGEPSTQQIVAEQDAGAMQVIEGAPVTDAFEEYDPQVTVMPRVGVSFPVTDQALFFASYNVTSQRPTERAFTTFRTFVELESAQGSRTNNPSLEPERTTQYELGFRQRIGERAALTLSGFYRTQENKISNRRLDGGLPTYGTYLNADFTTTKGAEVGFELRRTNNLAVNANYTLSFAQGTGSDANATAVIVWRGEYFPQFISPADFDQRHTANLSLDYRFGADEGPMVGGTRLLENFGVNVLAVYGSGRTYTPLVGSQFSVNDSFTAPAAGTINGSTLPATYRVDLKLDRSFDLGFAGSSLKAYLWVQNLFDTDNVLAVYRATGLANTDSYLETPGGESFLENALDPNGAAFNYSTFVASPVNVGGFHTSSGGLMYGQPRQIRLGLLFNF